LGDDCFDKRLREIDEFASLVSRHQGSQFFDRAHEILRGTRERVGAFLERLGWEVVYVGAALRRDIYAARCAPGEQAAAKPLRLWIRTKQHDRSQPLIYTTSCRVGSPGAYHDGLFVVQSR
jgi:hypothetical protein